LVNRLTLHKSLDIIRTSAHYSVMSSFTKESPMEKQLRAQDLATIAKVVKYLQGEPGAVSAQVALPSGMSVTVDRNGRVTA
jgi:hypothetical protein